MDAEPRNPESRSSRALWGFFIGASMCALAWIGAVLSAVAPALIGGISPLLIGRGGLAILGLGAIFGGLMMMVSAMWLVVRVLADRREAARKERYDDVQL